MQYRQLGDSGLAVSVGRPRLQQLRPAARRRRDPRGRGRGARRRHHPLRHRRRLRRRRVSEVLLGEALEGRRDDVVIATKFGMRHARAPTGRTGAPAARAATSAGRSRRSLRRLRHRLDRPLPAPPPGPAHADRGDPLRARRPRPRGQGALHRLSNFAGWQIADADWTARTARLERVRQRAERVHPARPGRRGRAGARPCEQLGVGMLPYFPLASGLLTGKYRRGEPPPDGTRLARRPTSARADARFDVIEKLEAFAAERG